MNVAIGALIVFLVGSVPGAPGTSTLACPSAKVTSRSGSSSTFSFSRTTMSALAE